MGVGKAILFGGFDIGSRGGIKKGIGQTLMAGGAAAAGVSSGGSNDKEALKLAKEQNKLLSEMNRNVRKSKEALDKFSPMLHQQIVILKKAWMLFWRPVGDIFARLIKPFVALMLKAAIWVYKFFSGAGGTTISAARKPFDLAGEKPYDPSTMKGPELDIGGPGMSVAEAGAAGGGMGLTAGLLTGNPVLAAVLAAAGTMIGATTQAFLIWLDEDGKVFFKDLWDTILDSFTGEDGVKTWPGKILEALLAPFLGDDDDAPKSWAGKLLNVILTGLSFGPLAPIYWAGKLLSVIKDAFEDPDGVRTWPGKLWALIKKLWNENVPSWLGGSSGGAAGGYVEKTGLYKLHAGENVVTAGKSNLAQGVSTKITNYYNIVANIANDMDIRTLAKKLAELQEVELRRRVSYI